MAFSAGCHWRLLDKIQRGNNYICILSIHLCLCLYPCLYIYIYIYPSINPTRQQFESWRERMIGVLGLTDLLRPFRASNEHASADDRASQELTGLPPLNRAGRRCWQYKYLLRITILTIHRKAPLSSTVRLSRASVAPRALTYAHARIPHAPRKISWALTWF